MVKYLLVFAMLILLSSCSSRSTVSIPGITSPSEPKFSELFLRGVFNWWEASPAYQFQSSSSGWYVDVELIADGQPYDFRISDSHWSPEQTCGARYQGLLVMRNETVYGVCGSGAENFQFTPAQTGIYRFTIAPASGGEISLVVTRKN